MARQIVINSSLSVETRVAVLEQQRLVEVFVERTRDRGIAGNIYKGRVTRVLPGMQAAFVDIGLDKAAYLHASDLDPHLEEEFIGDANEAPSGNAEAPASSQRRVPIQDRLKKDNEVLVQVVKPPLGSKGARISAVPSLPGRHLVFTPGTANIGVSRRIDDESERARLRELVNAERPASGGFIIRTACAGLSKREIQGDIRFLAKVWDRISRKAQKNGAPALLHYDMDVTLRTVRDLFTVDIERLIVDNPRDYHRILDFVDTVMPRMKSRVELYEAVEPIFDSFGIESQIAKALERTVWLPSGGYLVIDHTEALTVVDVNTGRFVGKKTQEETILQTNLEAARSIVAQLRLRNIGGLIVVDFIDMESRSHQRQVFDALTEAVKADKGRFKVLPMSELGLVEMTRKRNRESLSQLLCDPCHVCEGSGFTKSPATRAYDVMRRIEREAALNPGMVQIIVTVPPAVEQFLLKHESRTLSAMQSRLNKQIVVRSATTLGTRPFEISGVEAAIAVASA